MARNAGPGPPRAGRWADLRLRVISAAVLAPVALGCIWAGGLAWNALVVAAALAMGMEWAEIIGLRPHKWPGMLVPLGTVLAALGATIGQPAMALGALGALAAMAAVAWWWAGGWAAAGVAYVGVAVVALDWLRLGGAGAGPGSGSGPGSGHGPGPGLVLFLMLAVWASDIGAYVAGRIIGGPKLAPSISPGKTRSGAVGGLVAAAVVLMAAVLALGGHGIWWAGLAAVVLAAASQVGDLFESWIKRRFGVKDSGWLIPGHGGVLDRLDGVLTAAPAGALLVIALGREGMPWQ